jgi:threonine dehydratase
MTGQELRKPTSGGVKRAADKIASILPPTPLLPVDVDGRTIWCKAECLQPIGAFKIRGAWHRLTDLSDEERARGVVAFSSGNHAQGIAWAAKRLGMDATIVMPNDAPEGKLRNTQALGAKVVTYDRMTQDRVALAHALAAERGATVVPAYDDPWVIEGQGSAASEAAGQLQAQAGLQFDQIIACCGGGGLASGCALALPGASVVVVEPEGWDDMCLSLATGAIIPVGPNPPPTMCDALQTLKASPLTFEILHARQAKGVRVSEAEVAQAMRFAFERLRLVLEPGGAVALAALLAGKVELGHVPLVTLSGGNVDRAIFIAMIGD